MIQSVMRSARAKEDTVKKKRISQATENDHKLNDESDSQDPEKHTRKNGKRLRKISPTAKNDHKWNDESDSQLPKKDKRENDKRSRNTSLAAENDLNRDSDFIPVEKLQTKGKSKKNVNSIVVKACVLDNTIKNNKICSCELCVQKYFTCNEVNKLQLSVDEKIIKRKNYLRKNTKTPYNERTSYSLPKYVRELMKTLWENDPRQYDFASSLHKHEIRTHPMAYEKSINSYYSLVNEISDPLLQKVLESMQQQTIGIEDFELLLDPIQKQNLRQKMRQLDNNHEEETTRKKQKQDDSKISKDNEEDMQLSSQVSSMSISMDEEKSSETHDSEDDCFLGRKTTTLAMKKSSARRYSKLSRQNPNYSATNTKNPKFGFVEESESEQAGVGQSSSAIRASRSKKENAAVTGIYSATNTENPKFGFV
ncbi:hypothetical protein DAPPUDRAFT_320244 [Daphnia pulex]|uniref:Uncharacterized protein n=1 Tax=Daphnia pulex TaxID=6669 RepID=E9GPA8_DAPPU|nr:hypothetical protein DAPPUDRAFT_320244 [Daphnia pulex]|eukprot:EFX78608.1 hypothetical protein DAPPUDRAFT_320244 [Daphnia pulex]